MEPGPRREAPLDRGVGEMGTRDIVIGFIHDWLAWREQHQFNWTM